MSEFVSLLYNHYHHHHMVIGHKVRMGTPRFGQQLEGSIHFRSKFREIYIIQKTSYLPTILNTLSTL